MIQERLTGTESTSTFKKYYEMLKKQGIASESELRAAIEEVRAKYKLDTEAATVDTVRHALKDKFRPQVVERMFKAADGTPLDPKTSHQKMLEITEKLNSADKGTLAEEWVQKTRQKAREAVGLKDEVPEKVSVKKSDHPALTKDRQLDRVEGDTINEIKSTDSYLSTTDKAEIADHLKLIGKEGVTIDVRGTPRIVRRERVTFLHPEGARKNADYIARQLRASESFSVEVYNMAGESRVFTEATIDEFWKFIGGKPKT
jgi:hypothetical protein